MLKLTQKLSKFRDADPGSCVPFFEIVCIDHFLLNFITNTETSNFKF